MSEISYRQALKDAMIEELEQDENVVIIGEEVAQYNGAYKVTEGLLAQFGPKRIVDAPISEAGFRMISSCRTWTSLWQPLPLGWALTSRM